MDYIDGACCDATWSNGRAALAVVLIRSGHEYPASTKVVFVESSNDAEKAAIDFARRLYPGEWVYSDCSGAAQECDAIWIPREQNKSAHRAADSAWVGCFGRKRPRRRSVGKFRGRGVVPPIEKRMVFV